jgi:hypothetical protein
VLTWSSTAYASPSALGNVLSDYVDQGGGVVQAPLSFDSVSGRHLEGRWPTAGNRPFSEAPATSASGLTLLSDSPGHVLLSGVSAFIAPSGSQHHSPLALDAATTRVASWSDSEPLLALITASRKRIVGFNLYPPSSDAQLLANALLFASNQFPTVDVGADQTVEVTGPAGASFTLTGRCRRRRRCAQLLVVGTAAQRGNHHRQPAAGHAAADAELRRHADGQRWQGANERLGHAHRDRHHSAPVVAPAATIVADATDADGAVVSYGPVTAEDSVDGAVARPARNRSSGDTLVTCPRRLAWKRDDGDLHRSHQRSSE